MKKNLWKLTQMLSLALVLILALPVMMNAQAHKVDFSGSWALNTVKSSPSASNFSKKLVIEQEGDMLTATTIEEDGMSVINKYTLGGQESINRSHAIKTKATAKYSPDGKKLTILTKSVVDGVENTEEDVWSLIDSKTLSIVCTRVGTSGDEVTRFVYEKR